MELLLILCRSVTYDKMQISYISSRQERGNEHNVTLSPHLTAMRNLRNLEEGMRSRRGRALGVMQGVGVSRLLITRDGMDII